MINAYKTAASLALQVTPVVQKPVLISYRLQFDYTQMNEVMKIVKKFDCTVFEQELKLFCMMTIGISKKKLEDFLTKLKELKNVEIRRY